MIKIQNIKVQSYFNQRNCESGLYYQYLWYNAAITQYNAIVNDEDIKTCRSYLNIVFWYRYNKAHK